MGQDTTGTGLRDMAARTSRDVRYKVYIDFADVGFSVYPTGWTDVSAYVKRIQGDHQATDWRKSPAVVGSGVADEVSVTFRNPEDNSPASGLLFSPSNISSSLYATDNSLFLRRAVVEMGFYAGAYGVQTLRQITGYITGVDENRRGRSITLTIRDRATDATQTRTSTALYVNQTASGWMQVLAELLEIDPLTSSEERFDRGMMILPYVWLDDDTVWDEMSKTAEAQLGRVWFDKDGYLHFDDGTHFVKPNPSYSWDDATTSQFDFTTGNVQSIDGAYSLASVFNHIVVEYHPRYLATHQVIYSATETTIIPPGDTRYVKAEFRYPVQDAPFSIWGENGLEVDLAACAAGGTDLSDDITATLSTKAGYTQVKLDNGNENFAAYVYRLDIRGQPLLTDQADKYEAEDSTSIARYGRRTWRYNNAYIQTYQHAKMVGDYLLARYKDPIHIVRIAGARGVPWLETGDRVTVTDSLSGIDDEYFLTHFRWSFSPGSPYLMDLTAMKAADLFEHLDEYFVIGTSIYGNPPYYPHPDAYGRMFW